MKPETFANKDNVFAHGEPCLPLRLFLECLVDLHVRDGRRCCGEFVGLGTAEESLLLNILKHPAKLLIAGGAVIMA